MDITLLKKIVLFSDLNVKELQIVKGFLHHVKFKEGECLFKENEKGNELYILSKGKIGISKKMTLIEDRDEVDKTFITLSEEQNVFFGEIGLLGYKRRTASARAKTDCELYSIGQKDFNYISDNYPEIGFKILKQICLKLSNLLEKTDSDILKLTTALIYALKN